MGSRLLRTTYLSAYACAAGGAAFLGEHPAPPEAEHLATSWKLEEVEAMKSFVGRGRCTSVDFVRLDQCMCKARSIKPTWILAVNTEWFAQAVRDLPKGGRCDGSHPHEALAGRDDPRILFCAY